MTMKNDGWPEPLDLVALSKKQPSLPAKGFHFETVNGRLWVTLTWGGYEYDIEMDRIPTPQALLGWLAHLGEKGWAGMTAEQVSNFVRVVSRRKGWKIEPLP